MTIGSASDAGFIAVDAMAASLLVALVGTVVTTIALGFLQRQSEDLDRSVALIELQSIMRRVELLGGSLAAVEPSDELFDYALEASLSDAGLAIFTVSAHRRDTASGQLISMQFLAPADRQVR